MKPGSTAVDDTIDRSSAPTTLMSTLYDCHLSRVKRWASQLAGPSADLEDLVHDIFLVAFRKGFRERNEASVETWLFRITHHEVQAWRRRSRLRQLLLGRNQQVLEPPSPSTPQQEVERRERHTRLYRALDRLPDKYRTTLILYEIEELSGERVAELTETSLGTVWVRLHRGRERLVQLLVEEERS